MVNTIDMQDMRHLNLFAKITQINTRFCFTYNRTIFFCVPRPLIMKAVGREGANVRQISEILGKRIRVISNPRGIQDVKSFIEDIINPGTFRGLEIVGNEIVISAGNVQNKAALLGRNKQRLIELQKIIKDFFGKELRVA